MKLTNELRSKMREMLNDVDIAEESLLPRYGEGYCRRIFDGKGHVGGEIITSEGKKIIIPSEYQKVIFLQNGTIRVSKDLKDRGLLNHEGKEIIPISKRSLSKLINDLRKNGEKVLQELSDEELEELREEADNSENLDEQKLGSNLLLEQMRRYNKKEKEGIKIMEELKTEKESQLETAKQLENQLFENDKENDDATNEIEYEEHIDVDYENRNVSEEVKEYLSRPEAPKPINKIKLDGKEIYITDLMEVDGRKGFLGFAKRDGKYCMNYYIKSNSEGLRRCKPGNNDGGVITKMDEFNKLSPQLKQRLKDQGFNYTKNFSYERTTMVDFRIQEILDKKYHSKSEQKNCEKRYKESDQRYETDQEYMTRMSYHTPGGLITGLREHSKEKVQRFIDMSKEIDVEKDFSDIGFGKMSENKLEDVKEFYKNETFGIDVETLKISTDKKYKYNHDYLGIINVDVLEGKMEGEDIEIFFSSTEDEPEKVRIEQIQYKDQKINSYGIASKQINGGLLTAKPIEYDHQTPKEYWKSYFETGEGKRYGGYIDIRPIYQESPLIKKYKELINI